MRYQVIIQGDDGDELWEMDSQLFATQAQAEMHAPLVLREYPDAARAFINDGRMVNAGDDDDPDWVFEAGDEVAVVLPERQ